VEDNRQAAEDAEQERQGDRLAEPEDRKPRKDSIS
jgi:hypothetical protein